MMVEALTRNDHTKGTAKYSITQLFKPTQMLQLANRHAEEITRDATDMWNTFIGGCVHGGIYSAVKDNDDYILEQRYEMDVDGTIISGTIDAYQKSTKTLFDHKTMQCSAMGLEVKDGYEEQLNVYAYLLEKNGYTVENLMLNVIYLDWRVLAAKRAEPGKYPAAPVVLVPIKKWSAESVEAYLAGRIALHNAAEQLGDDEQVECTPEECWEVPAKIAIYRFKGALKAAKLCNNWAEVDDWFKWKNYKKSDFHVELRPGARRRCEMYCDAAPFCKQYKEWKKSNEGELNESAEM